MTTFNQPPAGELQPLRLQQRREHLVCEISRPSRPRRRASIVAIAFCGCAIVLGVAAAAGALGHSPPKLATSSLPTAEQASLSRVSAVGTPFALPQGDLRTERLVAAGYKDISLIGSRGGGNFFRLTSASGSSCYAWGRAGASWPLAVVACRSGGAPFPSPDAPVLDMSTVGSDSTDAPLRYIELAGVAADGVAAVEGLDPTGKVVVTAPVEGNLYYLSPSDVPGDVLSIQAVDHDGNVLDFAPR